MQLNHKIVIASTSFLILGSALFVAVPKKSDVEAVATLLIPPQTYTEGGGTAATTPTKLLHNQAVMEEAIHQLHSSAIPLEDVQKKILDLQNRTSMDQEKGASLFHIRVRHSRANVASQTANALAAAYIHQDLAKQQRYVSELKNRIAHKIQTSAEEIVKLETEIKSLENQLRQTDVDTALQRRLDVAVNKRRTLLESYTERHPDVIELGKQIQSLQEQILPPSPALQEQLETARQHLANSHGTYQGLIREQNDSLIEEGKISSQIRIIQPAQIPASPNPFSSALFVPALIAFGIAVLLFILWQTRK